MRTVTLTIDPTDFERLTQLGRSVIPSVAPAWTDHNVHDPGIMLVELLSWIADAQIYSLSRLRRDERLAYARLLGVELSGPVGARGHLWPGTGSGSGGGSPPPWPDGHVVTRGTRITAADPNTPAFFTTTDIELISARLDGVHTEFADGPVKDWTAVNSQHGATFLPFGEAPAPGDRLSLRFADARQHPGHADAVVAIGVQVVPPPPASGAPSESRAERVRHPVRLLVSLRDSAGERPLAIAGDTTRGLLRSGVILLHIPDGDRSDDATFAITLQSASGTFFRPPRVQQIAPNVLPIEQIERVQESPAFGNGLPDQTYQLTRPGLMFPFGQGDFTVRINQMGRSEDWVETESLETCGPEATAFELERTTGTLRFGNGINGRRPQPNSSLQVDYRVTSGAGGNLPADLRWSVEGIAGQFGVNSEATSGGADAPGLDRLRTVARERSRSARPIVTAADLRSAALAFSDLGVARAWEVEAGPAERRVAGTRILVVVGSGAGGAESGALLREIRARLAPRLPLGQRLEVVAPRFVPVKVTAQVTAAPRVSPDSLRQSVVKALRKRLVIVAERAGDSEWPFGRDVTPLAVKGWLRNVEGVTAVGEVKLSGDGRTRKDGSVRLGRRDLPLLTVDDADITVLRSSPEAGP